MAADADCNSFGEPRSANRLLRVGMGKVSGTCSACAAELPGRIATTADAIRRADGIRGENAGVAATYRSVKLDGEDSSTTVAGARASFQLAGGRVSFGLTLMGGSAQGSRRCGECSGFGIAATAGCARGVAKNTITIIVVAKRDTQSEDAGGEYPWEAKWVPLAALSRAYFALQPGPTRNVRACSACSQWGERNGRS